MFSFFFLKLNSKKKFVYITDSGGHRREYAELLSKHFKLTKLVGQVNPRSLSKLVFSDQVLFASIDDNIKLFFIVGLLRILFLKKTVGLFLRPHSCFFKTSLKSIIKRYLFTIFCYLPLISVITILPFKIYPHYRKIAKYSVLDPQIWDKFESIQSVYGLDQTLDIVKQIQDFAAGRKLISFIGTSGLNKGLKFILDVVSSTAWDSCKLCFVVAGIVPNESRGCCRALEMRGVLILDRFIDDKEIDILYFLSDSIWACYRPDYDQASGILGRALQFGKPAIVRDKSVAMQLSQYFSSPYIALDYQNPDLAATILSAWFFSPYKIQIEKFYRAKQEFLKCIRELL